jgi:hypothetical protein
MGLTRRRRLGRHWCRRWTKELLGVARERRVHVGEYTIEIDADP